MAAAKHTPGPWSFVNCGHDDDDSSLIATVALVGSCVVGMPFSNPASVCYDDHGSDEDDARLIAAAPSMYSLLQSAHDYIDRHSDVNRDGDGPNEAMALAASIRELLDKIDGSAT